LSPPLDKLYALSVVALNEASDYIGLLGNWWLDWWTLGL